MQTKYSILSTKDSKVINFLVLLPSARDDSLKGTCVVECPKFYKAISRISMALIKAIGGSGSKTIMLSLFERSP